MDYLGVHINFSRGNAKNSKEVIKDLDINCCALFIKPSLAKKSKPFTDEQVEDFKKYIKIPTFVHHAYTANFAKITSDKEGFSDEFVIGDQLGVEGIVLHPGSNSDHTKGLKLLYDNMEYLCKNYKTPPIIETMYSPKLVCSTFEDIAVITSKIPKVGVCFDTCHTYVAGYDIPNFEVVMKEFDRTIGLDKIKIFHLNDTVEDKGGHHDRHAPFPKGKFGKKFIRKIKEFGYFKNVPFILESRSVKGITLEKELKFIRDA
jgi:deoxyribonuclease-4